MKKAVKSMPEAAGKAINTKKKQKMDAKHKLSWCSVHGKEDQCKKAYH